MNTKTLIGALLGAVVMFLLGWLIYGILLKDQMGMEGDPDMMWIVIAQLLGGLLLAWVLTRMAVSTPGGGLATAALLALIMNAMMNAYMMSDTSGDWTINQAVMDIAASVVIMGAAGAVIGWYYGRGSTS